MNYYEEDFEINLGKARGGGKEKKNKKDCKKNKEVNVYNKKFIRKLTDKQISLNNTNNNPNKKTKKKN